jgi:hypothetical protein
VVHHLDLIEVGRHRIHFFDDDMLAAGMGPSNLETTVHTDFEKTMMASHVAPPPPRPKPRDDDLSRTMAIPREAARHAAALSHESMTADRDPKSGALALRALTGMRAGEVISLEKANTMLGVAGADSALVVRRGDGYYIARFGGNAPRLNRQELEPGAHPIAPRDVIEVGNVRYEVITAAR